MEKKIKIREASIEDAKTLDEMLTRLIRHEANYDKNLNDQSVVEDNYSLSAYNKNQHSRKSQYNSRSCTRFNSIYAAIPNAAAYGLHIKYCCYVFLIAT